MELTHHQKEEVLGAIDHILDFSENHHELSKQIHQLLTAFKESIPSEHDFYHLRLSLLSPTQVFNGIEKKNTNPTTLAAVKMEVLALLDTKLKEAAKKANLDLAEQGYDLISIKNQFITPSDESTLFVSERPPAPPTYLPWEVLADFNSIYTAQLVPYQFINPEFPEMTRIAVKCEIWIAPQPNLQIVWHQPYMEMPMSETSDATSEYEFIYHLIPQAKLYSRLIACDMILRHLKDEKIISENEFSMVDNRIFSHICAYSEPEHDMTPMIETDPSPLLTNHFYFNSLIEGKLDINFVLTLKSEQINAMINETVIDLVDKNILTFFEASIITQKQIRVATSYLTEINKKEFTVGYLLNLTDDHCSILLQPTIAHAIKNEKLSLENAVRIPAHLLRILTNSLYMEYMQKAKIDWHAFSKLTHGQTLFTADKHIANLIKHEIFSFSDITHFTRAIRQVLKKKFIQHLLLERAITLNDIESSYPSTFELLELNPIIHQLVQAKVLRLKDIDHKDLKSILKLAFVRRLFAIYLNHPHQVNDSTDHPKCILKDIRSAAEMFNLNQTTLINDIMKSFIVDLKSHIYEVMKVDMTEKDAKRFRNIFNHLDLTEDDKDNWEVIFSKLLTLTNEMIQKESKNTMQFFPLAPTKLQSFAQDIIFMNDFIDHASPQKKCHTG